MPSLAVVVPTRDRPGSVERLLRSLVDERPDQIVVVDDGSSDPLRVEGPATLVRNERPRMLSAARNRGAEATPADVLFFVDDDCVVAPGTVGSLRRAFAADPKLGIVGPVIAYLSDPRTIWCAGADRHRWLGLTRLRGAGLPIETARRLGPRCESFPSAFAVRSDLFRALGGLDAESFPMHMAESDLGDRVRSAGFHVSLLPEALVWHDIEPAASLARRLHLADEERAFAVARDRVRYLLAAPIGRAERITQLLFYVAALVPAYLMAIALDGGRSLRERRAAGAAFVRGTAAGFRRRGERPTSDARAVRI